jgi:hypothetical protein
MIALLPVVAAAQVQNPSAGGAVPPHARSVPWWMVFIALAVILLVVSFVRRTNHMRTRER